MTRRECLDKAAECVLQDRASQYGGPEDNFGRIAKLWSTYTGTVLDGIDVAMMMALLKVARIRNNKSYEDGYIDLAGYAACGAELAGAEKAREDATRRWGEEYKKLREQAEGGCCQNGKDHAIPEFKSGDAVEWNSVGSDWLPAVYEREFGDFGRCVVRLPDGRERIVSKADLRKAEANHPENPDGSIAAQPKFKHGDKVEVYTPSRGWFEATYVHGVVPYHAVEDAEGRSLFVLDRSIRRPSKARAEGCEALVEKDAPQTPHDLYKRIIDANPATFHTPSYAEEQLDHHSRLQTHKPTGEELAEMAEEEKHV